LLQFLQVIVSGQAKNLEEADTRIQAVAEAASGAKTEIDALKFEVTGLRAESSGLSVFVSSMQVSILSRILNVGQKSFRANFGKIICGLIPAVIFEQNY
jgi:hypothetical protein